MSVVESLALVTSVMTVITFARETATSCKALYNGESVDTNMRDKASELGRATEEMEKNCNTLTPQSPGEKSLVELARKCQKLAEGLVAEIDRAEGGGKAKGSLYKSIKSSLRVSMGKSKLERMEEDLNGFQTVLRTRILAHLWTRQDAARVEQSEGFDQLEGHFKGFISQYAKGHADLEELITTEHTRAMHHTTKTVEQAQKDITAQVTEASGRTALEARQQTLLRSLKYPGMNERRNFIKESHHETFQWVLRPRSELGSQKHDDQSEEDIWDDDSFPFIEWAQSDQSFYWISGKPGSGKSTLMKFIIDSPKTNSALQSWRSGCMILSHYFWKPGNSLQRNIKGLWCSVAYQRLLAEDGEGLIRSAFEQFSDMQYKSEQNDWSVKEIEDLCFAILGRQSIPLCIFIDGMDEINDDDGVAALKHVLSALSEKAGEGMIKFCLASRPEPRFRAWLNGLPELKLHTVTRKDMVQLVAERLSAPLIEWGANEDMAQTVRNLLVSKADGVFLWLVLAIKGVIRGLDEVNSEEEILSRIEQIPGDMEELYVEMWHRVNGNDDLYHATAAKIFSFVILAQRHLPERATLLNTMIATTPRYQRLLSESALEPIDVEVQKINEQCHKSRYQIEIRCAGLLETTTSARRPLEDEVVFIHRTAYDFLTTTASGRKLLGTHLSFELDLSDEMLELLFVTTWLSEVIDSVYWRRLSLKPILNSTFKLLLYSSLQQHGRSTAHLSRRLLSLESRLESRVCFEPTRALRLAHVLCQLLWDYAGSLYHRSEMERPDLIQELPLDQRPSWEPAILRMKIEAVRAFSQGESSSMILTIVLREYLSFRDLLDHAHLRSMVSHLLEMGADPNVLGTRQFLEDSPRLLGGTFPPAMGSATERLLLQMLRNITKFGETKRSPRNPVRNQQGLDALLLMIKSENDLSRYSIVGKYLGDLHLRTKLNLDMRSFECRGSPTPDFEDGKVRVIFKVTLAHLLFPLLYRFQGEDKLSDSSHRTLKALRDLYVKCPVEPARLVGIMVDNSAGKLLRWSFSTYRMRETNGLLPTTTTVEELWRGAEGFEMPDDQGDHGFPADTRANLRKAFKDGELEVFTGDINEFFAGESPVDSSQYN